jgi:aldehyde dehydrogenase (NAD+)
MGGEVIDLGADYHHSFTRHEPYGVVAIITPWNSPLAQLARGLGPALAMGNAVAAKPSEFTSAGSVALAMACVDWGLPPGLFDVVTGLGAEAGAALVAHMDVRMVAFTGSVRAGQTIGAKAAERIIPVSLELGGKSGNIVFDGCDLAAAVSGAVTGFTANAGQLCSAGTRLLVQSSIHDAFVARLKEALAGIRVGRAEACTMRPIITSP